jgi:UDP:flavonoid glycosyltransferase YjiC (YdhE family)
MERKNLVCGGGGDAGACRASAGAGAHAGPATLRRAFRLRARLRAIFQAPLRHWPLTSISSARFLAALAAGKPVYDARTLHQYVLDDMRLLQAVRPDVVIGDFRLSLSVSARLAEVPYVALANAYWSPYVHQHYQVPALPLSRVLPIALADRLFKLVRPLAFALHCRPLNRVRRAYRMPSLGYDLRRIYTDADHVLYADIPEMFPAHHLPVTHSYLGPVTWSPPMEAPSWWDVLPGGRELVYVTLGSSGQGACCRACCRRWRRCR